MSQPPINENTDSSSDPNYFKNSNCFNTDNSVSNVWNNCTIAGEDSGILAWLSPLEPQTRHDDIRTHRVEKVGDWLLQTEEYRNWLGGTSSGEPNCSALFCYGGPGVGKTYLSSMVIDTLREQAVQENASVGCFYFDFAAPEEQSPAIVLGSVLKQVVGGLDEVPKGMVKVFRDRGRVVDGPRLVLSQIVEFLQDITSSRPTFICIDALDECQPAYRMKILDLLNQIIQKSPAARLFLTGRPHIRSEVERHLAGRAATRSITPTRSDIIIFLRAKLGEDTMPDEMDQNLWEEIIQNLPGVVSEIFLLAFLSIETILRETTIYGRRQRLRAMQNGLDLGGAYGTTLERIKAQDEKKARLGTAVLMWISHSKRPLQVDEICCALAIRIGTNDLDYDNIPRTSTLLACCQGLTTIDKGTSTIRLIHFTLQEHLQTHLGFFDKAHSTMAETCLTYLGFQHAKDLSSDPLVDRGTPFLEYSALYWGTHMRAEPSNRSKAFALQLLDQFDSHIASNFLWESITKEFAKQAFIRRGTSTRKGFSALHYISYLGIAQVANALLEMNKWDVNKRDGAGITPLIWAASCGHEEVVELLLQQKHIQPDQHDANNCRTALSWAAGNGHEGVVRIFLGPRFFSPGRIGRWWGRAPDAAGLLFSRTYVNPDSSSESDRTPLSWAAENGHEGIVKLLLGRRDVNPDSSNKLGRTPLWWAARNGQEGIVKLLLERKDVSPNSPATSGQVPLHWAARNGYEGIVKLLLGRKDVNPDHSDRLGVTPLMLAAMRGHEGAVKLLLGRKDVNPNTQKRLVGATPLLLAVDSGREGVVKLLLGRRDVNPEIPDTELGQTPVACAARRGHEGVVRLLLERKDVNPDTPDTIFSRTPLSLAARNGHKGVVKVLLERKDVNPNTPDTECGRTPLAWAVDNGYEGVLQLLLEQKDVNPDTQDTKYGRTPLWLASRNGHERAVKLLLERKDVNPNTPDTEYGRTPLAWAAENGYEGIVKLLVERKDVSPDTPDTKYGRTPLSLAAGRGHKGIVKLLLGRRDVSPNTSSKLGQTPLMYAAKNGHTGVVELFQA